MAGIIVARLWYQMMLQHPVLLAQCMPGTDHLDKVADSTKGESNEVTFDGDLQADGTNCQRGPTAARYNLDDDCEESL
jgi:hypothetical protein